MPHGKWKSGRISRVEKSSIHYRDEKDDLKPLIGQWNAMAPMGRLGKPEELQSILVYLAGDTSTFTTGSDIIVDGAFTCF